MSGLMRDRVGLVVREMKRRLVQRGSLVEWDVHGFSMPAPTRVKWAVLHRYGHPAGTWIESGTYLGETTDFLATSAAHVFTIEPEPSLAALAREKFRLRSNVTVIEGLSEQHLGGLVASIRGPLSLWLDGHFSAGITHRGPRETPILEELSAVEEHMHRFAELTVFVDDVRCFDPCHSEYGAYPPRSWLVQWADRCGFDWTIEHDIFVAVKPKGRLQAREHNEIDGVG